MQTRVALTYIGEDGQRREVAVDSRRFTIGSSADNDLVINAPGVSRRHAVIESFEDGVYIYDCQTQQGTLLNNAPLAQAAVLHSGDLLTFGGTHDFTVRLNALHNSSAASNNPRQPTTQQASNHAPQSTRAAAPFVLLSPAAPKVAGQPQPRSSIALIAGVAAGVLILLVGGLLFLVNRQSPSGANRAVHEGAPGALDSSESTQPASPAGDNSSTAVSGDANSVADEELEREASRIVQRLSGDDKAYVFPPEAMQDVRRQVEAYRQSAGLRAALAAMQPSVRTIATQARGEGVQPELVIYAALAGSSDGGENPVALARSLIPQLRELRATFGSSDADSSLLILAAHTYGVGSKKSHPLLATIRRLVKNSFTERNVWHMRAHGGLSDTAYRSVVRTIAAGVIAQDPRRHGVEAAPLVY
jgi:pSer/pThr/pTyr-binding forkhead associated (FHA) protein